MSAPDAVTTTLPAVVKVQRAAEDRDAGLASAVLAVWDLLVRALDLSEAEKPEDPEPIAALREQLAATSRRDWAEGHAKRMAESHALARRQAGVPSYDRRFGDGTRPRPLDDENDLVASRRQMLAKGQAARHAEMAAAGGYVGDATDLHRATRKQRADLYARMREQEGQ